MNQINKSLIFQYETRKKKIHQCFQEDLKEKLTIAELAEHYKLYPTQISTCKAEFLSKSANVFGLDQSESADEK